jgi:aspartyl-tRNA(Asn)/glutamyl-tRNA(Gln) amidotransferase subunit A
MTSSYPTLTLSGLPDLHTTLAALRAGTTDPQKELERAIAMAQAPASAQVYLQTCFDEARAALAAAVAVASPPAPLSGLPFSAKDLLDVQDQVTLAGSRVMQGAAPAAADCPAVARMKAAGGVLIGRTNMVEFAFSGVGVNPHYGTPANAAAWPAGDVPRIPGGSSSGAAVSVATGSAFIGLGSDTGGSIRIPAALNGIVGFKNTARLTPLDGVLPLSFTMDTVCALTRSVRDAITAHEILAARTVPKRNKPLAAHRVAVARTMMFDGAEPAVLHAFEAALGALRRAGCAVEDIELPELNELPALNATGGFSPAEAFAWHYQRITDNRALYDPRVLARIEHGAAMSAREYIELLRGRRHWIASVEAALAPYDAVLSPTVPITAVPIAQVAPGPERDAEFFRINGLLLRNTAAINFLDGCAISVPCHAPGSAPVGLMLWAAAMQDDAVLHFASEVENCLKNIYL